MNVSAGPASRVTMGPATTAASLARVAVASRPGAVALIWTFGGLTCRTRNTPPCQREEQIMRRPAFERLNSDGRRIVASIFNARMTRRRLLANVSLGASAIAMYGALGPARVRAVSPVQTYPQRTDPIADSIEGAIQFWLDAMQDAVPDDSSDVVLSADEIAELKAMAPRVGHSWYGFFVPAIVGWNRFWEESVDQWAMEKIVFDVQGKSERDIAAVDLMIQQNVSVIGTLAVDWVVFSEAMRKMHAANVASTSVVAPSSAYFPTTSTIMPDQTENARDLVMPMARKLRDEGIIETDVVLLSISSPTFFDIARTKGFKEGLALPEVREVCKMTLVVEKSVAPGVEDAQAATTAALQQYPNAHVIAALGHWYAGASAAIRDTGRQDAWVIAFDLDEGTAIDLLTGGWPVHVTYSLPIAQSGRADANVMGKILLGNPVPLIVKTVGTVTIADNVEAAWANDWGGEDMPF